MEDRDFQDFMASRWDRAVRAAVLLGCPPEDAEDVAQATFVKAYVHWRRLASTEHPDAYLHKMLLNEVRARWRKLLRLQRTQQRTQQDLEPPEYTTDGADAVVVAHTVRRALDNLPRSAREVVVLRYFVQLSERETAQALGLPAGTVKSRLSRALDALGQDQSISELREDLR